VSGLEKPCPGRFRIGRTRKPPIASSPVFASKSVSEDKILDGHFAASAQRIKARDGPILILQDTTEFSFKRKAPEKIGFTKIATGAKGKDRRHQRHKICGLLMHASLALTPEGLPLGLTAAKFWSRDKFKGTTALKRKINPTRASVSWFAVASTVLPRTAVRPSVMEGIQSAGPHEIAYRDANGKAQQAVLNVKLTTMTVRPPIGKQKKYQHQEHRDLLLDPENWMQN